MLATKAITKAAHTISAQLLFLSGIDSKESYEAALELMDELIEDYDNNIVLIEALSNVISRYEDDSEEYALFNKRSRDLSPPIATLRVLMEQYGLRITDFETEIGKKSLVSQILTGKRALTRDHIQNLVDRFGLSPALFF